MFSEKAVLLKKTRTIGIYTPDIQGFYFGEIINQVRQLSEIKGYRLVVIRTASLGHFNLSLNLDDLDAVIILRNAILPALAERLVASKKPCVSIAYDYFPLKIPMVTSNNEEGIRLAFEYLNDKGHENMVFVGDLSQYDLRKRYEYFCDLLEQNGVPVSDDHLLQVHDTLFSGGYQAADEYVKRGLAATGFIFGSGLIGVGFIRQINSLRNQGQDGLDYVCFDALALLPVLTPDLASVDQNIHLIAYRALNCLETQLSGIEPALQTLVDPKLICPNGDNNYDAFIATCVDTPSFHNPNYMKAVTGDTFEWVDRIVQSDLDEIMTLSPLFERLLCRAFLSRFVLDKDGVCWVKHTKTFTQASVESIQVRDAKNLCLLEKFPCQTIDTSLPGEWDICIHIPITVDERDWGLLSLYGGDSRNAYPASYFAYGGILEFIADRYGSALTLTKRNNLIKQLQAKVPPPSAVSPQATYSDSDRGYLTWDFEQNVLVWSDQALALLQFSKKFETSIYRNLELTEYIHPQDLEVFRRTIYQFKLDGRAFEIDVRVRLKSGRHQGFRLSCETHQQGGMQLATLSLRRLSEPGDVGATD